MWYQLLLLSTVDDELVHSSPGAPQVFSRFELLAQLAVLTLGADRVNVDRYMRGEVMRIGTI